MTVSGEQRRDSAREGTPPYMQREPDAHIHVSLLLQTPLPPRVPHNTKQSCLRYTAHPCWEVTLEKEMATHSSILAWRIPWKEEPGGLLSLDDVPRMVLHGLTHFIQ